MVIKYSRNCFRNWVPWDTSVFFYMEYPQFYMGCMWVMVIFKRFLPVMPDSYHRDAILVKPINLAVIKYGWLVHPP